MFPDNLLNYRILLASASPRRRELLSMLGIHFDLAPALDIDEVYPGSLPPLEVSEYLARLKAEAHLPSSGPADLIITADTTVICQDQILGKPTDASDAVRMLRLLSGKTHTVVSGIAVATHARISSTSAHTQVTFADLTDDEIEHYVTRYRPFDKAGAYGIQEWIGAIGVTEIQGSYYNVMGLPLHRLYRLLQTF